MIRFFLFQELDIASNYNEKEVGTGPNLYWLWNMKFISKTGCLAANEAI